MFSLRGFNCFFVFHGLFIFFCWIWRLKACRNRPFSKLPVQQHWRSSLSINTSSREIENVAGTVPNAGEADKTSHEDENAKQTLTCHQTWALLKTSWLAKAAQGWPELTFWPWEYSRYSRRSDIFELHGLLALSLLHVKRFFKVFLWDSAKLSIKWPKIVDQENNIHLTHWIAKSDEHFDFGPEWPWRKYWRKRRQQDIKKNSQVYKTPSNSAQWTSIHLSKDTYWRPEDTSTVRSLSEWFARVAGRISKPVGHWRVAWVP